MTEQFKAKWTVFLALWEAEQRRNLEWERRGARSADLQALAKQAGIQVDNRGLGHLIGKEPRATSRIYFGHAYWTLHQDALPQNPKRTRRKATAIKQA